MIIAMGCNGYGGSYTTAVGLAAVEMALTARAPEWVPEKATLLFAEGSPGGSWFVVVSDVVEVSIAVNGKDQFLARLWPGSVFGQVSLIDGEPRSASCTIGRDAVLVELKGPECEQFLERRSPLALKLLALLNDGIISALRGADRRLMRLEEEESAAQV